MLRRRRISVPLLMLVIAFSYAEDSNSATNEPNLAQNEAVNLTITGEVTTSQPIEADNLSSSTTTLKSIETTAATVKTTTNGISLIATRLETENVYGVIQGEQPPQVQQQRDQQQRVQQQQSTRTETETGRFKGGTVQLVLNTPSTQYPQYQYQTTPYPYTRPPPHYQQYPYPPHYPYPYPTQAPTAALPSWPPYWPPGAVGAFPGYGFAYGYPGYGYPWFYPQQHYNNTERSANVGIASVNQARLNEQVEVEIKEKPTKSTPFFSFFNFGRK